MAQQQPGKKLKKKLDCEKELHAFDERLKNKEAGLKQKMVIIDP